MIHVLITTKSKLFQSLNSEDFTNFASVAEYESKHCFAKLFCEILSLHSLFLLANSSILCKNWETICLFQKKSSVSFIHLKSIFWLILVILATSSCAETMSECFIRLAFTLYKSVDQFVLNPQCIIHRDIVCQST